MGRPPKPFSVLEGEKKSHRTAEEMRVRREAEESVLTGEKIAEEKRVKDNEIAHKTFKRTIKLLEKIQKNDAIYEKVINRYCLLTAECQEMEMRIALLRERYAAMQEREIEIEEVEDAERRIQMILDVERQLTSIDRTINTTEGKLQTKRNALFAIEKESCMTVAAALRAIPKKEGKKKNPVKEILSGSG